MLFIINSFIDWKNKQNKIIRGNEIMYDIKGYYKYLYEHELFNYYVKIKIYGTF
jgi:hypothetical protein